MNFKYDAIPTFCFYGIVGHEKNYFERLFDTPSEMLERLYGAWMMAESKHRSHTMGVKLLRPGGVTPATSMAADGGKWDNKVVSVHIVEGDNVGKKIRKCC